MAGPSAPDEPLAFGVVGLTSDHVWGMGDGLTRIPGVEITCAADPHDALREQATGRWALRATYADYGELLDRQRPDAVLVCGDNAGKPAVAAAAASRGIHVYQDKPMAATLGGADEILRAAEKAGIVLMVAYHTAFNPAYDAVKRAVGAGAIGKVYLARGCIGHGGPVEFGCSQYFCDWLFDKQRNGGGSLVDEGCYLVTELVDNLGEVVEVSAFTAQIGHRDYLPPDVEDNAVAILRFASGALGILDAKWGQVGPAPVRTSYHGTDGTIITRTGGTDLVTRRPDVDLDGWHEAADPDSALAGSPRRAPADQGALRVLQPAPAPADTGSRGAEQRRFVAALRAGSPLPRAATPAVARHVQEVLEAAYLSAEQGRAVRLPLTAS